MTQEDLTYKLLKTIKDLDGKATIIDLRFKTKFKYHSRTLVAKLQKLQTLGIVKYVQYNHHSGHCKGYWQIA